MKNETKLEFNSAGNNPTAEFIDNQYTGKFFEILPNIFMVKGAVNNRGFNQGYAVGNNTRKELVLIDVVEEASREGVEAILNNGYNIKAVLITGKEVLQDAYADLETISEEAGGAEIYLHPDIKPKDDFTTRALTNNDSLLSSFNVEITELPANKNGEVLIFCGMNGGMIFPGNSAKGSIYKDDSFIFSREKKEKQSEEFEISKFWQGYNKEFTYFFPRIGKPAIEIDNRTRSNIFNWLSRGSS